MALTHELPHRATWKRTETAEVASHPLVQETIAYFLGFGRQYPPEILDEALVWQIFTLAQSLGPIEAARFYRTHTPKRLRAECRAVLMNLTKMRKDFGGKYPWEA